MGKFKRGIIYEGDTTKLLNTQKKAVDNIKYSDKLEWIGDNVGIYSIPYKQEGFTLNISNRTITPLMIPFPCKISFSEDTIFYIWMSINYISGSNIISGWITSNATNNSYICTYPGVIAIEYLSNHSKDHTPVPITFTPISMEECYNSIVKDTDCSVFTNCSDYTVLNSKKFLDDITNASNSNTWTRLLYSSKYDALAVSFWRKNVSYNNV